VVLLLPVLACFTVGAEENVEGLGEMPCASAILMDAATGTVLFEQNADEALPPASVTKVMTLLLVMEAVESGRISLSDPVSTSAKAASMGGSQVYLKEGECMTVEEMVKCVVIASANDCAVALAEHVAGSEEAFVATMNARAAELGMKNTCFENTNGLDDTAKMHLTSARDIALMSRALIAHPKILEYSGIWMDTIRNGAFGLTNTNRLVRFYPGCTGLKTGSTARAGFCVSATAKREGISLVCVIMGAESRDSRNASAARLLDFGFANYETFRAQGGECRLPVQGSDLAQVLVKWPAVCITVPKGSAARVKVVQKLPVCPMAPVEAGQSVGDIVYTLGGKEVGSVSATAAHGAARIGFGSLFKNLFFHFLLL
jgi:D-alanyl-D-alanine carboxypeptidase (penicillin-binding protein 5/6)